MRLPLLVCAALLIARPAHAADRSLPDDLMTTVTKHGDQLQRCYRRALRDAPELRGKLVVRFRVGPTGRARRVMIVSDESTLHDVKVETCVAAVFRGMRFRPMSEPTWYRSPLIFRA